MTAKRHHEDVVVSDDRAIRALAFIAKYKYAEGARRKQWILSQVARILSDDFEAWVKEFEFGKYGPKTYNWDEGAQP